jgi:hypothetical protein
MSRDLDRASLPRCAGVWLLATAALVGLAAWLLPGAVAGTASTGDGFDTVLVRLCELTLLGCGAWLWVVTAVVTVDAARGRTAARAGTPRWLRRALLGACGVALAGSLATPSHATPPQPAGDRSGAGPLVAGLPLPDRATAAGHVGRLLAREMARETARHGFGPEHVVVGPGDTLWSLAGADLPPGATDAAISRYWRRIYRANREVIGPDPDLILPHQRLRLPRR